MLCTHVVDKSTGKMCGSVLEASVPVWFELPDAPEALGGFDLEVYGYAVEKEEFSVHCKDGEHPAPEEITHLVTAKLAKRAINEGGDPGWGFDRTTGEPQPGSPYETTIARVRAGAETRVQDPVAG